MKCSVLFFQYMLLNIMLLQGMAADFNGFGLFELGLKTERILVALSLLCQLISAAVGYIVIQLILQEVNGFICEM